jgi:glutamate synthase domain-containing protein 3
MTGGEIAIRPSHVAPFTTPQVIAGNTNLYGATGGHLFAAGRAGERFCVRNSGATAVVEGIGDHGCEYMTGGTVVVLGPTGDNFGAGMTNGEAFVYDREGELPSKINGESVLLEPVIGSTHTDKLRSLVDRHLAMTGSSHARRLLDDWSSALQFFWKVVPRVSIVARAEAEATAEAEPSRGAAD